MPLLPTPLVSARQLLGVHADSRVGIVDCRFGLDDTMRGREAWEYSSIPFARYAHLDDDLSTAIGDGSNGRHPLPEPEHVASLRRDWGFDEHTHIVCFDDAGGPFAARLWWMLRWIGHEAVSVLNGGWQAWLEVDGPTAPGHSRPWNSAPDDSERTLTGSITLRTDMVTSADEIGLGRVCTVDARARERYLGTTEPLDAVAGHIPGAFSMPWMENLDPDGQFLAPEMLAQRWKAAGGTENAVSYCGSGVTACHNILAADIAGLPLPRLFPPSWSGWIHDPSRPVATGEER